MVYVHDAGRDADGERGRVRVRGQRSPAAAEGAFKGQRASIVFEGIGLPVLRMQDEWNKVIY